MNTRVTYAQYEVLRMEYLLWQWVRKLKEYPRIIDEATDAKWQWEAWQWEALETVATQTKELLALGEQRRKNIPENIPDDFILIRQTLPAGKTLEELVAPREMKAPSVIGSGSGVVPMGAGPMPDYLPWDYTEPYCHPVRHVRAFGFRCKEDFPYRDHGIFALLTPDHSRTRSCYAHQSAVSALCYDWMAPINWHVDLRDYQVATGPYTGMSAHEHKGQIACLRYRSGQGRLVQRGKVVKTHVPVEWVMHLVPPYAITLLGKKKGRR